MNNPKKNINLQGYSFYRYDDAFKKKVLDDVAKSLISELNLLFCIILIGNVFHSGEKL